ncbi:prolyl oligopeptidase family serine peptidase [bacterium]|nr:prolyl oligopeptidase family serine peptidase [bacterium]
MYLTNRNTETRGLWFFILLIFLANPVVSQNLNVETISVDPDRMNRYLVAEAEKLRNEAWERINTPEKLEKERDTLLREFRFMIGLEPLPERTPLHVTIVRTVDRPEYTVEVLHYQSLPGFYVTANIYRPKKGKAPFPGVIWGPGHSAHPDGAKALRQNYAIPWVRAGYICMIIDPIQVAEVFGIHRGTHSWEFYDWYARGYTPAGIEVWNAMRAVDYLLTRPDVDGSRLTINGVSGGGHLSWMTGTADDRIAVVQPVAGTADVLAHIELDLQQRHCDCAYFINTYRHDWCTLAALISPRPLLMHNSTDDIYYPPEGYKRVLEQAQTLYSFSGEPDKTGMFEVPGEHGYFQAQREKAVEWSNYWLMGKTTKIEEKPFDPITDAELSVFGEAVPPDAINAGIQETFIPAAKPVVCENLELWKIKRSEILDKLNTVVFRNMPRPWKGVVKKTGIGNACILETEPGIEVGMISWSPSPEGGKKPAVLYIASPGDTENSASNFLRSYPFLSDSTTRHIVYPRGIGTTIWNGIERRRFERCAMLLGRTVDEMRLYDVLCAVDYVASLPSFDGHLTITGRGMQGLLGAYAALLDDRIERVILHSPPLSHRSGPIFLNILRYTDIPVSLALLAPRELVFLTYEIESFDYTKKVYHLYNADNRFRRGYTVTQILNTEK